MLSKVVAAIENNCLFSKGDTLIVAVSGGADSTALLHLLASLDRFDLTLVVAHLNHLLRGAESDGDEEFVRQLASTLGCRCCVRRTDVAAFAAEKRLSLEEAGRECRYAFFDELILEHGARAVALAHHADDQAETVLMRLIRGSAGSGLCGMTPRSAGGRYVRPLLGIRRHQIMDYLSRHNIPYRTDSSNGDTAFLRNSIRHRLIPLLEEYNRAITDRLTSTAESLAADEQVLNAVTEQLFTSLAVPFAGGFTLSVERVLREPLGSRLRLYRHLIGQVRGDLRRLARSHLMAVDVLCRSEKPHATIVLPDGLTARKSYDRIMIVIDSEPVAERTEVVIAGPGTYRFGSYIFTIGEGGENRPAMQGTRLPSTCYRLRFRGF